MTLRTRSRAGLGGIALAGTLLVAGCGGGASAANPKVASVGEVTTTTAPAAESTSGDEGDVQDAMLAFAQCMRDHGVDMPDPQVNAEGRGVFTAAGAPADAAKMDEAQKACQAYLDKVKSEMPPPDPAEQEARKQQMLDFAQCMRDHGIAMPDPEITTDGGGIQVKMGGPGIDDSSPAFKEANEACAAQVGMEGFGVATAPGSGGSGAATEVKP
jgi:hypothetical protein